MELDYAAMGGRIKRIRTERKLSQEKLAELVDISVPYMCNMENGKAKFSMQILVDLAGALNVTPDALILGHTGRQVKAQPRSVEGIHRELEACTMAQMLMLEEIICSTKQVLEQYDCKLKAQGTERRMEV